MNLKLYIKQTDQVTGLGQQIHYAGLNPQSLNLVNGGLPVDRQFPNYGSWVDVTSEASDLFDLSITFTTERDTDGVVVPGGLNSKKAAAGTITLEGSARQLLKKWLFDDVSAQLNRVDVKIEHVGCGTYEGFVITSYDVRWCEDDTCIIDTNLKLKEAVETCIRSTVISDNWQGWFQKEPANGKKHPRFSYCNEVKPNGMLAAMWYIMNTFSSTFFIFLFPVILGYNGLVAVILTIQNTINAIINIVGGTPLNFGLDFIDIDDIFAPLTQFFVESAGCGREHPAPLMRDYIQNVCDKCGIKVTPETVPIFFNPQFWSPAGSFMETSTGMVTGNNPHYNACYLTPTSQRGVRRFKGLMPVVPPFINNSADITTYYLPENAPIEALDQFLDRLKDLYNAEWRVKYVQGEPTLYFWRKDFYLTGTNGVLFDFSKNGADRNLLLEGVCFEVTEKRNFASAKGIYASDAADTCGNEALGQMNGYVEFGNTDENPTFEGISDLTTQFGATRFNLDAAGSCYYYDALQIVANSATLTPGPSFTFQLDKVGDAFLEFADHALLMRDDTCTLPKVLLWDGGSYLNAKCVKEISAEAIAGYIPPVPDVNYNPNLIQWPFYHEPKTFVAGSGANLGNYPIGYYTVRTALGIAVIIQNPALLVNWPMYFAPGFMGGMWDFFHYIDDPKRNPRLNFGISAKIELCCEVLQRLEPFNNSENVQLGAIIRVNKDFQNEAVITEIGIHYNSDDEDSRYVELKGLI